MRLYFAEDLLCTIFQISCCCAVSYFLLSPFFFLPRVYFLLLREYLFCHNLYIFCHEHFSFSTMNFLLLQNFCVAARFSLLAWPISFSLWEFFFCCEFSSFALSYIFFARSSFLLPLGFLFCWEFFSFTVRLVDRRSYKS